MNVTQRQVNLGLFGVMSAGTLLVLLYELFTVNDRLSMLYTAIGALIFGALWFAYWRGWQYATQTLVVLITLMVIVATQEPYLTQMSSLAILIPPILALIMTRPGWVIGSAAAVLIGLNIRTQGIGSYADPLTIILFAMIIGGMILARMVTDTAHRTVTAHARRAEEAQAHAEQQAQELIEANELMNAQLDQQSQLLDLVTTLETPVVPLAEGMLFAPIVGHIDTRRAQALTTRLLQEASTQRARLVLLDVAGVSMMDTAVAKALIHTVQALRLLGCEVTLSGISASVAIALIHLGVNLEDVRTVRSPQEALAQYLGTATSSSKSARPSIANTQKLAPHENGKAINN
jgi:rsbT co-antagonist protein RsbR